MKRDSLSEKLLNNLQNTTIDAGYAEDQSRISEILVVAEFA